MKADIYEIITKAITGKEMSESEEEVLSLWKNENSKFYNQIESYCKQVKSIQGEQEIDVNKAYQRFIEKKKQNKRIKRFSIVKQSLKYAAVLAILVAGTLIMMQYGKQEIAQEQYFSSIVPGKAQAELVLDNGEMVRLNNEKTSKQISNSDGTVVDNIGSQLAYRKQDRKNKKLNYNNLIVPRGGEYELILSDGTKVKVNSETQLRYPTQFASHERVVYLEGEAFFDVSKEQDRPFFVCSNGVKVKVLGTSFNVNSYPEEENITTTLVSGSVEVYHQESADNKIKISPNHQVIYSKTLQKMSQKQVDVEEYVAWKDGRFIFKQASLVDIMQKLSRWYDVKIFYVNEEVKDIRFTGNMKRYESFNRVLNMLEKTQEVKFSLNGKAVLVEKKVKK